MFVDAELLRSGAGESRRAGEYAQQAAQRLSRGALQPQMFGDFAAAAAFHEAAAVAQSHHVRVSFSNQETLAAVGNSAHLAAVKFTEMDQYSVREVRAVRCSSAT